MAEREYRGHVPVNPRKGVATDINVYFVGKSGEHVGVKTVVEIGAALLAEEARVNKQQRRLRVASEGINVVAIEVAQASTVTAAQREWQRRCGARDDEEEDIKRYVEEREAAETRGRKPDPRERREREIARRNEYAAAILSKWLEGFGVDPGGADIKVKRHVPQGSKRAILPGKDPSYSSSPAETMLTFTMDGYPYKCFTTVHPQDEGHVIRVYMIGKRDYLRQATTLAEIGKALLAEGYRVPSARF